MLDPLSVSIPLNEEAKQQQEPEPTRFLLTPSDVPDEYIMEMDYSAISNYIVCPRKSENYSVRHREIVRDNSAQNFGRLFHQLEEKRLLVGWTDQLDKVQAEMIAAHFVKYPPAGPDDHRTSSMIHDVMRGYKVRYKNDGMEKQVVIHEGEPFVERPFKVPLMTIDVHDYIPYPFELLVKSSATNPIRFFVSKIHVIYTGRLDALIFDNATLFWVEDKKTSSRGGSEFLEAFRLSLQTRGYCWVAQKILRKPIAGLLLNAVIVRKPTKTGKNLEYDRHNFFYSPDLISEWEDDMKAHVTSFVSCLVRGFFPQSSLSFKSPCPSCEYFENCSLPRNQRAADLASKLYRDVTWNPMKEQ